MTNIQSANLPFLNLPSKKNFSSNQNSNNKIPLANVSAKISKYPTNKYRCSLQRGAISKGKSGKDQHH